MKIKLHVFEVAQSFILFGVSTWFTCERFAELSGGGFATVLPFVLLGFGFELTRVSLWIRYCLDKVQSYKWVALFLTVLSIVASLSKITANLEVIQASGAGASRVVVAQEKIITGYDEQIKILLDRLQETPKDYVTTARKLQEQIDTLMAKRNEVLIEQSAKATEAAEATVESKKRDMFDVLGAVFGFKEALVKLLRMIFLGLVTMGSEIGLLISSKAAVERKEMPIGEETKDGYGGQYQGGVQDNNKVQQGEGVDSVDVVRERTLTDILFRTKRKGAYPFPSIQTLASNGFVVTKEDYKELVEKLWKRGVLYTRGGRAWIGKGIEREDIEEVLNENA